MNDRKISMLAIRYLCQVAEAITFQIMNRAPGAVQAAEASMQCSDHAEHIAQYDIEGVEFGFRMRVIAACMEWLMVIVQQHGDLLAASSLHVPSTADLGAIASFASRQHT